MNVLSFFWFITGRFPHHSFQQKKDFSDTSSSSNLIVSGPLAEIVVLTFWFYLEAYPAGRFVNGIWYPFTIDKIFRSFLIFSDCFSNWNSFPASVTLDIPSVNNFPLARFINSSGTSLELVVNASGSNFVLLVNASDSNFELFWLMSEAAVLGFCSKCQRQ